MKYKAILFDMDGTLLPMDNDVFTKGYFKFLYKKLAKYNLNAETFSGDIWSGVAAMVKNDGSRTNEEAFWDHFITKIGRAEEKDAIYADCKEFYGKEFHEAKQFTSENPLAKVAVELAHKAAEHVVLATNPLFPMVGQRTRMSWMGLSEEDFEFVTCYESECYCKPNPQYFVEVCKRIGVTPAECLMIGNDEEEDMQAAKTAGLDCYLVTDCMIASKTKPWDGKKGTFEEMVEFLKNIDTL